MDRRINATDAARTFSELLNTVRFQGARYIIVRGGKPVASLVPVEQPRVDFTLRDLRALLDELPRLDPEEASAFDDDLQWVIAHRPPAGNATEWD